MPRRPRGDLPDGIYHVTTRATSRLQLFVDDHDRERFLWLLNDNAVRFGVRVLAYCLMDTHYHLLVEGTSAALGALMRRLNGRYAGHYNARHDHRGHVFGERYAVYVVRDEQHLEATLAYIRDNPVKVGLCERSEDWPWTRIAGVGEHRGQTPAASVPQR